MKVLLIVGNEVLQRSIGDALTAQGHDVRLESGGTADDRSATDMPEHPARQLTPNAAGASDVSDVAVIINQPRSLDGAAASGVAAAPTDRVFSGTAPGAARRVILVTAAADAGRAGTDASGPEAGAPLSPLAQFAGEWLHLRTSVVYGISEDPVTLFLIMMRSLPAVPLLSNDHPFSPLWHEDLAAAVAAAVSQPASEINRVVDLSGPDTVTQEQLYERIAALIDRRPIRVPVPDFLAVHGGRLAEALRLPVPPSMLPVNFGGGAVRESGANTPGHATAFGLTLTSLDAGLRQLMRDLEEKTPAEGVGSIEVKRFSTVIRDSQHDATGLLRLFRSAFKEVMPIAVGVEPAVPDSALTPGGVVTMTLPGRGHVQVRVEEVTDHHVIVGTLRGHALAGFVRFSAHDLARSTLGDGKHDVTFEVMACDAAGSALDWLSLTLGGSRAQDLNWIRVVQNVAKLSAGSAEEVQTDAHVLDEREVEEIQQWMRELIELRRSSESIAGPS